MTKHKKEQHRLINAHIAREMIVSAGISGGISALFFFGLFWQMHDVPVTGWGGYAFDFVPQSAPVALMACLVPGLLARRAVTTGALSRATISAPSVRLILGLSLICAAFGAVLGAAVALAWIGTGIPAIAHGPALLIKIIYGALLGAFVTRRVLQRLLLIAPHAKD